MVYNASFHPISPNYCNYSQGINCGNCAGSNQTKRQNFTIPILTKGTYHIKLTPHTSNGGRYTLTVQCQSIPTTSTSDTTVFCGESVIDATTIRGEPRTHELVLTNYANVTFDNCRTHYKPSMVIYDSNFADISNSSCPSGDNCGECSNYNDNRRRENFTLHWLEPDTYYIEIKPVLYTFGVYRIDITCQTYLTTLSPTLFVTDQSSDNPTLNPTISPIIDVCIPEFTITAEWASSIFDEISVHIQNYNNNTISVGKKGWISCSNIFDANTLDLLRESDCYWIGNVEGLLITIRLKPTDTINLNDSLIIRPSAIKFGCINDNEVIYNANSIIIASIDTLPAYITAQSPHIISSLPSQIGNCDDLVLDARSTTGLYRKADAVFKWDIYINNLYIRTYSGPYVVILNDELTTSVTYSITLTVTNWYQSSSYMTFDVFIQNTAIPNVWLTGITRYSSDMLNLNGIVYITSHISFNDACLDYNKLDYIIYWTVTADPIYDDTTVDADALMKLNTLLTDFEFLSIDADSYLQSGVKYTFNMNLQCIGEYQCNINSQHQLIYEYSDIECGIVGNEIILHDIDPADFFNDIVIELNGALLSYDPETKSDSNNHLMWSWNCTVNNEEQCSFVLNTVNESVIYADLSLFDFQYSSFYSFFFSMAISDKNNWKRAACNDLFTIQISTKNKLDVDYNIPNVFIVTVTAVETEINKYERLRLLASVINSDDSNAMYYNYEWIETTGLLTVEQINSYKAANDDHDSSNLILKENVLQFGTTYSFQLKVSQFDANLNLVGFGTSSPVTINILNEPIVETDSLEIVPECSNIQFSSITQLLSTPFALKMYYDDQYIPLSYQFGHNYNDNDNDHYFESNSLTDSFLENVYLPVGVFNIFGNVINSKSSITTSSVPCSISLESYSDCLEIKTFLLRSIPRSHKLSFIFQQTDSYLKYLKYYYGSDSDCIINSLNDIISVLQDYVLNNIEQETICNTMYPISLSQTITSLIDIINEFSLQNIFDYHSLIDLIIETLDPCNIVYHMEISALSVSKDTSITKIAKIYYKKEEITNKLSPIVSKINYHHLLHSIISSLIDINIFKYLSHNNAIKLYNLVSYTLYISELFGISFSIPGETMKAEFNDFSLQSFRVSNEEINVTINNINIYIPTDVTNAGDAILDSVDIVIFGMDTMTTNNVSILNSQTENIQQAKLSNDSISVAILGENTNTSYLPSDVEFLFPFHSELLLFENDTVKCAWYNTQSDIWQTDGCVTSIIDYELPDLQKTNSIPTVSKSKNIGNEGSVLCKCSHLTTFALIYSINDHSNTGNNIYVSEWLASDAWVYINFFIAILFFIIVCYTLYSIYPVCVSIHRKKIANFKWSDHKSVVCVTLIGITAFLHFVACMTAYNLKEMFNYNMNSTYISIKIYFMILLLPKMTYFMIFSIIAYSWFNIVHAFRPDIHYIKKKVQKGLIILNIFILSVLITYYISVLLTHNTHADFKYLMIGSYIWCSVLSLTTILITIYSFLVGKVLYKSSQISSNQSFGAAEWKVARRLMIINSFITVYFMFQAFTTVYLSIKPMHHSIIWNLSQQFMDVLCLFILCWMYHAAMQKKRATANAKSRQQSRQRRATVPTKISTVSNSKETPTNSGCRLASPSIDLSKMSSSRRGSRDITATNDNELITPNDAITPSVKFSVNLMPIPAITPTGSITPTEAITSSVRFSVNLTTIPDNEEPENLDKEKSVSMIV